MTNNKKLQLKIKSIIDFIFSIFVLVTLSPILLFISGMVKIDGGPVIYKQKRIGLNEKSFDCYKFRTMVTNAEILQSSLLDKNEQTGPVFKIKNDPRITKVGKFLRKSSLDELPQFLNIIKGEMSVVGPRPPIPKEVNHYEDWHKRRLSVKPGITCTWQVSGRNEIGFNEWMKMDIEYIDNWSLKTDLNIMAKTVKTILSFNGQ